VSTHDLPDSRHREAAGRGTACHAGPLACHAGLDPASSVFRHWIADQVRNDETTVCNDEKTLRRDERTAFDDERTACSDDKTAFDEEEVASMKNLRKCT